MAASAVGAGLATPARAESESFVAPPQVPVNASDLPEFSGVGGSSAPTDQWFQDLNGHAAASLAFSNDGLDFAIHSVDELKNAQKVNLSYEPSAPYGKDQIAHLVDTLSVTEKMDESDPAGQVVLPQFFVAWQDPATGAVKTGLVDAAAADYSAAPASDGYSTYGFGGTVSLGFKGKAADLKGALGISSQSGNFNVVDTSDFLRAVADSPIDFRVYEVSFNMGAFGSAASHASGVARSFQIADTTYPLATIDNATPPRVSGVANPGRVLAASNGEWTAASQDLAYSYQWLRNGTAISGATSNSYAVRAGDVGADIAVRVNVRGASWQRGAAATSGSVSVTFARSSTGRAPLSEQPASRAATPTPQTRDQAVAHAPAAGSVPAQVAASSSLLPSGARLAAGRATVARDGSSVAVRLGSAWANQWVYAVLYSQPDQVGWVLADGSGTARVAIPGDVTGSHTVALYDAAGGVAGFASVRIVAAAPQPTSASNLPGGATKGGRAGGALANTGAATGAALALAATLLALGGGALALRRRMR